ncbi:MAG: nicotinate phosphoribosyltransferase [Thermoanaerobaculales bacterium]|nr:nicotinate phosphoribosyltransferase [Thermoanaerobaculales bacterium]
MTPIDREQGVGFLFTDFYQLTMAQLYFRHGLHEHSALFDYFYRSNPNYGQHNAGYCVCAGLEWFVDWMLGTRPTAKDTAYLQSLKGQTGARLFADDFIDWLGQNDLFSSLSVRAIPEGRVVHPNVPLVVIQGPLAIAQLVETPLLNHLNYQTLVATKASRIRAAARGGPIFEFGMRRAHEHGANAGARASLIGGADFSSNTAISAALGFPPKGTHAHSMVQAFIALGGSEIDAFRAYAEIYPDDCVLLVDTINTLQSGVPNAIRVFDELRRKGHRPLGIRLDSGDLAFLAIQAAKQLNAAGYQEVFVVLSNNLDELVIWQIITQIQEEAPRYGVDPDKLVGRLVYGIGTRLITSRGDSALDGVCKLVAVSDDERWQPAIKLSETKAKTLNPGNKRVWRVYDSHGKATADLIALADEDPREAETLVLRHPTDEGRYRTLQRRQISSIEPLHVDVVQTGRRVGDPPSIEAIRALRSSDLECLYPGVKRLMNPHVYHVSLSQALWDFKQGLVSSMRSSIRD